MYENFCYLRWMKIETKIHFLFFSWRIDVISIVVEDTNHNIHKIVHKRKKKIYWEAEHFIVKISFPSLFSLSLYIFCLLTKPWCSMCVSLSPCSAAWKGWDMRPFSLKTSSKKFFNESVIENAMQVKLRELVFLSKKKCDLPYIP